MAITTFIPTLWSARLLANLDNLHVATNFVNRDYEGEIKQKGDKVKINALGPITIGNYTGAAIGDPEKLSTTDQMLEITEGKFFNFSVDDVDRVQAAGNLMDKAMKRAAYGINDIMDKFIFTKLAASATQSGSAEVALTAANIYSEILKIRKIMDKNNVPKTGRKLCIPPDASALLLEDERFSKTGGTMAEDMLKTGLIGQIAGFKVFESNNLPTTPAAHEAPEKITIIAGHDMGGTVAEQVLETVAYQPEQLFADAVKGLHVYGAKVTIPQCYVKLVSTYA